MTNQRVVVVLALIALLALGMGADAATPIRVCGKVTDYFVSDIASGGRIEIDGKNYPIASSASTYAATARRESAALVTLSPR